MNFRSIGPEPQTDNLRVIFFFWFSDRWSCKQIFAQVQEDLQILTRLCFCLLKRLTFQPSEKKTSSWTKAESLLLKFYFAKLFLLLEMESDKTKNVLFLARDWGLDLRPEHSFTKLRKIYFWSKYIWSKIFAVHIPWDGPKGPQAISGPGPFARAILGNSTKKKK